MDTLLSYAPASDPRGYLEIIKIFPDGTEETHFSDRNVICSGMGATLQQAFLAANSSGISDYQIQYFQVGTGGTGALQVSSNGALGTPCVPLQYGASPGFEGIQRQLFASGASLGQMTFGIIPWPYIKKISPTRVLYSIYLGDASLPDVAISEVGLFSKSPLPGVNASMLCAYRAFPTLVKQDGFSILFRWAIEF
tara:strand:+ start:668 stop:1252 length:585 start_codon:yes stop_codon:yes gene_type:complete